MAYKALVVCCVCGKELSYSRLGVSAHMIAHARKKEIQQSEKQLMVKNTFNGIARTG